MKRFYKILKFVVIFILILVAIYISFGFISGGFKATITEASPSMHARSRFGQCSRILKNIPIGIRSCASQAHNTKPAKIR